MDLHMRTLGLAANREAGLLILEQYERYVSSPISPAIIPTGAAGENRKSMEGEKTHPQYEVTFTT